MKILWDKALTISKTISDDYSIWEKEQKAIFDAAITCPRESKFVELGVCRGRTSVILASVAQFLDGSFYGIDGFILAGTADEFRAVMDQHNLPYTLLEGSTNDVWKGQPQVKLDIEIDFLLIDASHDDTYFPPDLAIWLPKVKSGGIVAFDDWAILDYEDTDFTKITQKELHARSLESIKFSGPGPDHNPHWAVSYFGELATGDWDLLDYTGRVCIKRKP